MNTEIIEQFNNKWYSIPVQSIIFPSSNSEGDLKKDFITTILSMPRQEDRGKAENQALFKIQDMIAFGLERASSASEFGEKLKTYMSALSQYGFPATHEAIKIWYLNQDLSDDVISQNDTQLPSTGEEKPNYLLWGSIILGVIFVARKIK